MGEGDHAVSVRHHGHRFRRRLVASAEKAERKKMREAERQIEASTKTARLARRFTRAAEADASASDYAAGEV